jgi:Trk K+ transport system NAD-binding subunit
LSSSVGAVGKGQTVDLGDGYVIRELTLPPHLQGRSLRELAVRERTQVHVLLVRGKTADGRTRPVQVPGADYVLGEGDSLVAAGTSEALQRFEGLR